MNVLCADILVMFLKPLVQIVVSSHSTLNQVIDCVELALANFDSDIVKYGL